MSRNRSVEAKDVVATVARRLKAARNERRMSLAQLAAKSSVSRSMVSQIERGETNPTLATLWNLTRALGVDFAGLIDPGNSGGDGAEIERLNRDQLPEIDSQTGCRLQILSPPDLAGQFEWYHLELEPGGVLNSEPHTPGASEHLTVLSGQITLRSGESSETAAPGATLRYRADVAHSIAATKRARARCLLVVDLL